MGKFFNLDAPWVQVLGKIGQMMIMSVLWVVCCLPVITVGASTAALFRMMFNLKEYRSCTLKDFFKAFKENFRKATVLWLFLLACAAVLAVLFYLVVLVESNMLRLVVVVVFSVLFFAIFIMSLYLFPLTAYFENTVSGTIRNAVAMGLGNLRNSIFAGAVTLLPLVLYIVSYEIFMQLSFLMLILGPGAITYGVVCALTPVFERYMPANEAAQMHT